MAKMAAASLAAPRRSPRPSFRFRQASQPPTAKSTNISTVVRTSFAFWTAVRAEGCMRSGRVQGDTRRK
jgi:hypothetical protein